MDAQNVKPENLEAKTPDTPNATNANVHLLPEMDAKERRRQAQARLEAFHAELNTILDPELTTTQRIERLISMQAQVLPELMAELLFGSQSETRSVIASRTMQAIRDISALIAKKHDVESEDTFNARSPKVRAVFGWLIELFHDILRKHTEDEILISNVFNDFANQLAGWEERVERKLKGIPTRLLGELETPFTSDFYEKVKRAEIELKR